MEVKSFKAFRYDTAVVGDVGSCIAPPYDVISTEQQQKLYKNSEYNIVRIIKGKTESSDNDSNNQYTRAAEYLNGWTEKGILKQDSADSIYAYVQDFQLDGANAQRFSFIALGKLEEFGKTVMPHEQTMNAPKIDRLNLQKATAGQFGLILMLYDDEQAIADKIIETAVRQAPLVDFVDEQNVRHRLFLIAAQSDIEAIENMMSDKSCIIADGHHRYETALNYYKETSNPAAGYQMFAFANMRNEGLVVLATHRLVGNLENFSSEKLISEMARNFEVTEYKFDSPHGKIDAKLKTLAQMKNEQSAERNAFGLYAGNGAFYVAVLKNKQLMDSVVPRMSSAWRSLDVSVLHKLILEELLELDEQRLTKGGNVEYVKDTPTAIDDSISKVDSGGRQVAFFTNPPKIEQIQLVAQAGEKMPQKSTYFYPKVYTGLTVYKF